MHPVGALLNAKLELYVSACLASNSAPNTQMQACHRFAVACEQGQQRPGHRALYPANAHLNCHRVAS